MTAASTRWTAALSSLRPSAASSPFPAWDTVPYDRIGPNADIAAQAHRGAGTAVVARARSR